MPKIVLNEDLIKKFAPRGNPEIIKALAADLPAALAKYEINTKLRVAHFLAQAAHESDYFKTLQGYADGSAFEGRLDLGNTHPGDGKKYKERGIFQLAGRYNYVRFGKDLGVDLENDPELAATSKWSTLIAAKYWEQRKINALADANDIEGVTKKINGGLNGLASRKKLFDKVMTIIDQIVDPVEVKFEPVEEVKPVVEVKPVTTAPVQTKPSTVTPVPKPAQVTPAPKPVEVKPVVVKPAPVNNQKTEVVVKPAVVAPKKPATVVDVLRKVFSPKPKDGVVGSNINLRSDDSMNSRVLDVVKKGTKVKVSEKSGNWFKVTVGQKTGWVYKDYLHIK